MVYHGRIVVAGITPKGEQFAAYSISGRSSFSKKRKFDLAADRVYVAPIGRPTAEQEKLRHLIFYNAMRARGDTLFVTNGAQTDLQENENRRILNFCDDFQGASPLNEAEAIMAEWGYENDPPIFTPRTALVRYPTNRAIFSMATKFLGGTGVGAIDMHLGKGCPRGLATYRGEDNSPTPWSIENSGYIDKCMIHVPIDTETPEEIADQLYRFVDQDLVVASAGAVLKDGRWEIAVKNRFKTEEEFQMYTAEREAGK